MRMSSNFYHRSITEFDNSEMASVIIGHGKKAFRKKTGSYQGQA